MRQLFTILAAVLLTASVFSQSPEKMTYQAVLRDVNQTLLTGQKVGMQISILQGSPTGTVVYSEIQTPTTNINGLVSIEIGSGIGFYTIDWANGPYYLKTEIDPASGTNYTIIGISQLLSVPYALYAKTADSISGTIVETDPIFGASVAAGITQTDTTYWNNKLDIEIDGDSTNELQTLSLYNDSIIFLSDGGLVVLPEETDPIFGASVASGITSGDTAYWNNKLDSYTETDPIFGASVAAGITGTDTTYWNNKLDVETDPVFGASIAAGITATDTTNWNTAFAWGDHSAAGYFADGGEATGADRTLGNTDNFALGLKTNNATRLLIANNGNIGIGTTTPTEKLEVNGNIKADTTYTDVLYSNKVGDGIYDFNINGMLWADTAYLDSLFINADTLGSVLDFVLGVDSTGGQVYLIPKDSLSGSTGWTLDTDTTSTDKYVGIGITDPSEELEVVGTIKTDTSAYGTNAYIHNSDGTNDLTLTAPWRVREVVGSSSTYLQATAYLVSCQDDIVG
ncbi:MAG: hypothetical protein HQ565_04910 [Bacteroidetes bacterium]|nr:hypothetical protein [Bacteroidota bacterium]